MKQYEKAEYQAYLDSEKATIADIKKAYESALDQVDEKIRVLSTRKDIENMPSIIHQQKYQEQIKSQLESILGKLQDSQYKTVNEYLNDCYTEGFLHTMYSMQQQGVPFIMPIDQKAVKRAVVLDSKISGGLYSKIVEDVSAFKRQISAEISRGIASSLSYTEIARNLKAASNVPISNASRIVRTEGHRIQSQAKLDSMNEAKDKGADVVKQWDSTLDGKTRETHRELDGQIREIDEDFEIQGMSASAPSLFGDPAEDCNCRCTCLTRARWALSSGFSKMDNFTKQLQDFESPDDYDAFKKDYWSKENLEYMNYVTDMEDKYGTKNFEQVLDSMSDKEYEHYKELMANDPMYSSMNFDPVDSNIGQSDAQKINLENNGNYDKIEAGTQASAGEILTDPILKAKVMREAISREEPFYAQDLRDAYKRYGVQPKKDCYDVLIHGAPTFVEYEHKYNLDTETLFMIISGRRDYQMDDIRLLSCSTGKADKNGNCVAQELADRLKVKVYAPIDTLNINPDGSLTVGAKDLPEEEGFKWFEPR